MENSSIQPSSKFFLPRRAYSILKEYFESLVVSEQQYLKKDVNLEKIFQILNSVCAFLKHDKKKGELKKAYDSILQMETSEERWSAIQSLFKDKDKLTKRCWGMIERELTIGLLYPKIDSHVSAQTNHLLKCPFNIHHSTGKLSLPILDIENFDVLKCPTVFDALENKSMMDDYFHEFDKFCAGIIPQSS
jgi:DNA primase catalytic subunit